MFQLSARRCAIEDVVTEGRFPPRPVFQTRMYCRNVMPSIHTIPRSLPPLPPPRIVDHPPDRPPRHTPVSPRDQHEASGQTNVITNRTLWWGHGGVTTRRHHHQNHHIHINNSHDNNNNHEHHQCHHHDHHHNANSNTYSLIIRVVVTLSIVICSI